MPRSPRLLDLAPIHGLAAGEARRLRRSLGLPSHEHEDLRQDLLVDFLARLPAFDPARAELAAFARLCFRHASARIARRVQRERAVRHTLSLDDALPGRDRLTLGDTVGEADGYGAWCRQPIDAITALERRLDLERAAAIAVDPEDRHLCAGLSVHTPHELGELRTMPRMRIYRRIRELRLRLLAAGIPSAA
jgi:RNA polymerase sigma-70 factor (ECF subfamily)